MSKRISAILAALLIIFQTSMTAAASEPPKETELYAKSAVLADADSGRILYEKNGHTPMANASTTKILTCILALENCELESVVEVSANAASQPKVRLGMRQGQKFYLKDLLYGLMLESFNDCAVAIAEHIAGTTENFAAMMNRKAEEIGCVDSYFITPNGLDAKNEKGFHHTTAADLAQIMRYCIRQSEMAEKFLEVTRTAQYTFSDVDGKSQYSCYNHNAFLQMMEGALSGKTGFTGNAGYCYVGSLVRDKKTYIVALLACGWPNNKTYKWADTKKLLNYGIENYEKRNLNEILPDEAKLGAIEVVGGQGERIGAETWVKPVVQTSAQQSSDIEELLIKKGEEITLNYELPETLYAPVEKDACIGKISYMLGDEVLKEELVTAEESVKKIDYLWCLRQVWQLMM